MEYNFRAGVQVKQGNVQWILARCIDFEVGLAPVKGLHPQLPVRPEDACHVWSSKSWRGISCHVGHESMSDLLMRLISQ